MIAQNNAGAPDPGQPAAPKASFVPLEPVLLKAFDKLTSQILIFLLGYMVIVVILFVLAPGLAAQFSPLLFLVPILAVLAYGWYQKQEIIRQGVAGGVKIWAGIVKNKGSVIGIEGTTQVPGGSVDVFGGLVTGEGKVAGIIASPEGLAADSKHESDEPYLLQNFRKLSAANRQQLIADTLRMLDKQGKANG